MKKIYCIIMLLLMANILDAQHKTMTIYHSGGTTDVVNLSSTDSIVIFICGASKVNYGGKFYNTVLIGNQCWLKENLDVGTMINGNQTPDPTPGGTIEKYCYYNDPASCTANGGLYQWNEAMQYVSTAGAKGICPTGWHIPTLAEFQTLSSTVGGDGNALKAIGQGYGNGAGTNTSGFSALLPGYRYVDGSFHYVGSFAHFWSSTETFYLRLVNNNSNISLYDGNKDYGFSVRCIKD